MKMDCEQARGRFLEQAPADAELRAHLNTCAQCAEAWQSLRATMALMDEWTAPEPSPYFDVRLQARLDEARREPQISRGWAWMRQPLFGIAGVRPLLAGALAVAMAVGLGFIVQPVQQSTADNRQPALNMKKGTAVSDLQVLEKNQDVVSNLDVLDDLNDLQPNSANDQI